MRQQHTILLVYAAKKIAQKTKLNIQAAKKELNLISSFFIYA